MVDKKIKKKFEIRFDKTIFYDILKITPPKAAKLANGGVEKILKNFTKKFDKSQNCDILNLTPQFAAKRCRRG